MKKIKYIDLFAGCGGLSLGFESLNEYENIAFVENWDPAIETFKENFPDSVLLGKDVTKIEKKDIKKINYNSIDLIIGGPPCQGFSLAGKRDPKDPRNSLFMDFVRLVGMVKPKMFLMENVRGLVSMETSNGEKVIDVISKEFEKIGYETKFKIIDAASYGVPQHRHRIFFVGIKGKNTFQFPREKYFEKEKILYDGTKLDKFKTVRDAIGDLEPLESGEISKNDELHFALNHSEKHIKWLSVTPEGKSAHSNEDSEYRPSSGYKTTYKRIWWDKPSPAVTTCFNSISSQNNVHPRDTRAISIREAARLQTFPDNFIFKGTVSSIRKQIGNAVPPKLAEELAKEIKKHLI